jgi:hypothetical protein
VNPVVAVFLGWLSLSEPLAPRTRVAAAVIVGAVALITRGPGSEGSGAGESERGDRRVPVGDRAARSAPSAKPIASKPKSVA